MTNATERFAVVGGINSQLLDDGSATSDWVDMENFDRVVFLVRIGAADTTLDAKLQSATDSNGTSAADITGKAITQFSATDDGQVALIEIKAEEIPAGRQHVACVVTAGNGTTGVQVNVEALGFDPRYMPASNFDSADVTEIVAPSA